MVGLSGHELAAWVGGQNLQLTLVTVSFRGMSPGDLSSFPSWAGILAGGTWGTLLVVSVSGWLERGTCCDLDVVSPRPWFLLARAWEGRAVVLGGQWPQVLGMPQALLRVFPWRKLWLCPAGPAGQRTLALCDPADFMRVVGGVWSLGAGEGQMGRSSW